MLRRYIVCRIFIFFVALSLAGATAAQDTVLTVSYKGTLDSLHSSILNQSRLFQVFLPPAFKPGGAEKYDVLYVLDGGNYNTGMITRTQHFVEDNGQMPPTIVVSVIGIDRNIELTPTHPETWQAPTGGAEKFLGYIKNELIPYINKSYPSNGINTLWGHSLGGMFVMYAMLSEPATFTSYIAVDPSIWWDNCYVAKMAAARLPALGNSNITLYISGRQGPDFNGMRIDTMELILKKMAPANLKWKVVAYPDETHSSVRFKTTYDGLRFTYAGFSGGISFEPMNGIVLQDKPYKIWYFDDTARVHFSTNGTPPTEDSGQVKRQTEFTGAATITYKRFTNRSQYDKTTDGHFTTDKMPSPVSKPKNAKPGGFSYSYYENSSGTWPELKTLKPLKTGITGKEFANALPRKNNYLVVVNGFLEIKEDGYYFLYFQGEKGSRLILGGKLLSQWEEKYHRNNYSFLVPLKKGFYSFRTESFLKKEDTMIVPYYLTPTAISGDDPNPIPLEEEYSNGE